MRLSELIAPAFYGVHADMRAGRHEEYFLKGGRGSAKSSFAAIELLLHLLRAPIRLLFKILLHIGAGFLALILINMAGALVGVTVGVNLLNAVIVAVLGVPGAVLVLLLTLLL